MFEYLKDWFYEWHEIIVLILDCTVFVALIFCFTSYSIARPSCELSTKDIGINSRWSFWGGCQVEVESGRWIPLENWYYTENK